jgi:hypothetical protein
MSVDSSAWSTPDSRSTRCLASAIVSPALGRHRLRTTWVRVPRRVWTASLWIDDVMPPTSRRPPTTRAPGSTDRATQSSVRVSGKR